MINDNSIEEAINKEFNEIMENAEKNKSDSHVFYNSKGEKIDSQKVTCADFKRPACATENQLIYLSSLFQNQLFDLITIFNSYRNWHCLINLSSYKITNLMLDDSLTLEKKIDKNKFCYKLFYTDNLNQKQNYGYLYFDKKLPLNDITKRNFSVEQLASLENPDSIYEKIIDQVVVKPFIDYLNCIKESQNKISHHTFISKTIPHHEWYSEGVELTFDICLDDDESQLSIFLFADIVKNFVSNYFSLQENSSLSCQKSDATNEEQATVSIGTFNWNNGQNIKKGNIFQLAKEEGAPVDILVEGKCVAKGEVVILDNHFGVMIQ